MLLKPINHQLHIHNEANRKFAVYDPARGEKGTLVIQRNGERCEIDIAELLGAQKLGAKPK